MRENWLQRNLVAILDTRLHEEFGAFGEIASTNAGFRSTGKFGADGPEIAMI